MAIKIDQMAASYDDYEVRRDNTTLPEKYPS